MDLGGELALLFAVDDGSLPEIRIEGLSPDSVAKALQVLDSLVAEAQSLPSQVAAPGHTVATLTVNDVTIPLIGVGVFKDGLILDYRMGPEWTSDRVNAFFEVLHRLCQVHPGAYAEIEPEAHHDARRSFQKAWMRFLSAKGAA